MVILVKASTHRNQRLLRRCAFGVNQILIGFGCEGDNMHQGGGNFVFLDGHAKRITGNVNRYVQQRSSDGLWYCTYETVSI